MENAPPQPGAARAPVEQHYRPSATFASSVRRHYLQFVKDLEQEGIFVSPEFCQGSLVGLV